MFFAFAVLIQKLGAADLDTLVAGLDQAVAADHADGACARRRRDRLAAVQTMDALLAHGLVVIGVIQRVGEIGRLPIDRNDVHPLRLPQRQPLVEFALVEQVRLLINKVNGGG